MKNIPFFTTEYGNASLILEEIPYRGEAYIRILHSKPNCIDELLRECVGFCRAVGADHVFAADHSDLKQYPLDNTVLELRGMIPESSSQLGCLWPVTQENVAHWRELYNEKMRSVPNAMTLKKADEKTILVESGAYYIHRDGKLLGIGWLSGNKILAVAALKKGMGETVLRTLASSAACNEFVLEVSSKNEKACRLYQRLGFVPVREITTWYKIF